MKISVISHDAGSSEILCAFIKKHINQADWVLYAKKGSPFEKIAMRNNLQIHKSIDLSECDALFFGTGWQEHFERSYVLEAKKRGIPSFVFLDHWSSYRERFGYPDKGWEINLPNFTIVSDKKAEKIVKKYAFPNPIRIDNIYLQDQLTLAQKENMTETDNLLFLSEPTDEVAFATFGDKSYWGFSQYSALEDILKNFEKFECSGLHIRLHPSEKKHQYASVLKKYPHVKSQIYPADFLPIEKDILRSKLIIGFDTMALYTSALLHKPVISYLPSDNREFLLPLPTSHQLRDLGVISSKHLKPINLSLRPGGMDFAVIKQLIKGFK